VTGHLLDVTMFWSPQGGGVARYLRTKRRWLQGRGDWLHSIVVPGPDTEETHGLPSLPLPASGGYRVAWQRRRCARVLEHLAPTVIEVGDPYRLAWSALDAGQRVGVPVVATCHSDLASLATLRLGPWAGRLAARYLRDVYANMDQVFAPSRWIAGRLRDLGLARVRHQPLGVDCRTFHPQRASLGWRAALNLPADARVLLYAGRFSAEKHLQVLADAVRRLGPPYVLILIGAGPAAPQPGPQVRIVPYQRSAYLLAGALAAADVFVHAGDQETFGLAVLEAMASGTPVVARAAAGMAELLHPDASISVPATSAAAFAEAIGSLDADALAAMSVAARAQALRFDWNHTFAGLMRSYQALAPSAVPAPAPAAPARIRAGQPPAPAARIEPARAGWFDGNGLDGSEFGGGAQHGSAPR
jgi:alpha-1,6-mannosyltransferase